METNGDTEGEERKVFILSLSVGAIDLGDRYPATTVTLQLGEET